MYEEREKESKRVMSTHSLTLLLCNREKERERKRETNFFIRYYFPYISVARKKKLDKSIEAAIPLKASKDLPVREFWCRTRSPS